MSESAVTPVRTLMERRRRIRRPWSLNLIALIFLVLPFANYIMLASKHVGFAGHLFFTGTYHLIVLKALSRLELLLLPLPFLISVGIFLVKRWGWWLLLIYSALVVGYNAVGVFTGPFLFNLRALLVTLLGIGAIIYFTRKDISAPYFKMYPRGWRYQKRRPIVLDVLVNNEMLKTRDAGEQGFFIQWSDCKLNPGDEVKLRFRLGETDYETMGGIVRVDDVGAGVAFRGMDAATRRELARALVELEKEDRV